MTGDADHNQNERARSFEDQARQGQVGFVAELLAFVAANKKWWLIPILVVLVLVGVLLVLASTAAAPLIYPLF